MGAERALDGGLRIEEVRPASATEWDRAFDGCAYATHFHSREWAEAWAAVGAGRLRPAPTAAHFSDGARAVLVLTRERRGRGRWPRALSNPAGTYGGWLAGPEVGAEHGRLLAGLMCAAAPESWWRVNPFDPFAGALDHGVPRAATVQDDETDVLDLRAGFEAVLTGFSRGHRSALSKARRAGVAVRGARGERDWDAYQAVVADSIRRWGARGGSADYPPRLFEEIRRGSRAKLWVAEHDGHVVAGALCFYAPHHAVYWHGATLERAFEVRPSTLLLAQVIEDACARGCEWFDFNPSGGLAGVREFKRRFGTRPLACPVVTHRSSRARVTERIMRAAGRRRSAPTKRSAGGAAAQP